MSRMGRRISCGWQQQAVIREPNTFDGHHMHSLTPIANVRAVITACVVLLLADLGIAQSPARPVSIESPAQSQQLWLVSTRHASSCPSLYETNRLQYWRSEAACQWTTSSLGELFASDDPNLRTLIYVHENRVAAADMLVMAKSSSAFISRTGSNLPSP